MLLTENTQTKNVRQVRNTKCAMYTLLLLVRQVQKKVLQLFKVYTTPIQLLTRLSQISWFHTDGIDAEDDELQ